MSRIGIFPIRPDRTRTGCPVRIRVRPDRIPDCPVRLKNPAGPDRIHGKIDKKWGSKNHRSLSLRIFIFLKIFQSKKDRLCWTIHQDSKEISENFISKVFFYYFYKCLTCTAMVKVTCTIRNKNIYLHLKKH